MSVQAWTYIFVGVTFSVYLTIAWLSRVRDTKGFYVAGQGVPSGANGMATAADWMSAASYISMAGLISTMGYAGGMYLMGWTGGFVLLALLIAPYLRKFGHYTVPDFIGDRYESNLARMVAVICAIFISFTYVAGQMRGVGVVFSRFLEVDINVGVVIGMAIVAVYATLGGMKGITWTQVVQYWVLITAFLIPAIAISIRLTGNLFPQAGLGAELVGSVDGSGVYLLERLNQIQTDLGFAAYTDTFVGGWDKVNVFLVTLALMVGTAGLPHVIVRFYTVKSVKAARWSAFWALFFISLLYLTAPATAAFSRYFMIDSLNSRTADDLPEWFENWERTGLILWLDDGDGALRYSAGEDNEVFRNGTLATAEVASLRAAHQQWLDTGGAAGADGRITLRNSGLSGPDRDIIVLAMPEMAGLANWLTSLRCCLTVLKPTPSTTSRLASCPTLKKRNWPNRSVSDLRERPKPSSRTSRWGTGFPDSFTTSPNIIRGCWASRAVTTEHARTRARSADTMRPVPERLEGFVCRWLTMTLFLWLRCVRSVHHFHVCNCNCPAKTRLDRRSLRR